MPFTSLLSYDLKELLVTKGIGSELARLKSKYCNHVTKSCSVLKAGLGFFLSARLQ